MQGVDELDAVLLNYLQKDNQMTAQHLGALVNLSTSAVQRRLQRLRRDKVIVADVSVVSPSAVGLGMSCVVEVSLHLGNSAMVDRFKQLILACPQVMQCYYVAGVYDFVVIVNARNMKDYEEFSKKYFMDNPDVKQFYTHVVIDNVKVGYHFTVQPLH